ncbi:hypothetical protein IST4116A_05551 [Burkholderia cenocepacia]|nr:hypothetical protein IST4112_05552 [Burkholderia cenocepacia]CAB5109526.1 hypothetical protein IST4113_05560 [Burkholderia cenocepacia]CAB5132312.1 hypothetical protein IST4134_05562 [Burkholderia cenocepacia]CAB5134567.1 hypothetical protein IST4129_05562 [Burkholderia cenocepacia]CAB5136134.1 hypothetical protein IST4116B_05545 [Burkholderia cenocepacia]
MNEQQYACVVARLAARFPVRRVTGRAARPVRATVPRFKESRHV